MHVKITIESTSLPNKLDQRGSSLIEVLVSMMVFSVALLGLANLQVVSKQNNHDAIQRVTATLLTKDIITKMQSNATALAQYVSATGTRTLGRTSIELEPAPNCQGEATPCSTAELAAHDLWQWEQAIDGTSETKNGASVGGMLLPTGCISGPSTGDAGIYTIAIAWRGKAKLRNSTASTCGEATGLYGETNEYRRVIVVRTFLDNQM